MKRKLKTKIRMKIRSRKIKTIKITKGSLTLIALIVEAPFSQKLANHAKNLQ